MSTPVLKSPFLRAFPGIGLFPTPREAELSPPAAGIAAANPPERNAFTPELGGTLDTFAALAVLFAVWAFANLQRLPAGIDAFLAQQVSVKSAVMVGGFALLWPRVLSLAGLYEPGPFRRREDILRVLGACAVGAVLAFVFPLMSLAPGLRMQTALFFWAGSVGATLAIRAPFWTLVGNARTRTVRRVIVLGSGPRALRVAQEIRASGDGVELLGFVDSNDHALSESLDAPKLGSLEELEEILMHQVVDEVLIALPIKSCYEQIQHAIGVCERTGTESKYLADVFQVAVARPRLEHGDRLSVVAMKVFHDDYRQQHEARGRLRVRRHRAGAAGAADAGHRHRHQDGQPGADLLAQERYGRNKRRFKMWKFRTMVPNAEVLQKLLESQNEAIGPAFKIRNDPRVTAVGRFLRKTSLDELPQLINVLRGDMSLVGPRPMAVRDVQLFDQAWFMRRFSAPPGMTGLWQVSGRSNLGFDDWVTLDLKYIDEWSLALDMKILAKTIPPCCAEWGRASLGAFMIQDESSAPSASGAARTPRGAGADQGDGAAGGGGLAGRTISAARWKFASAVSQGIFQFAVGVLLARLLPPDDFGVVALAMVVVGFAGLVGDLGLGPAVIQSRTLTPLHLRTSFTASLLLGAGLTLVLLAVAPFSSTLLRNPELPGVLRLLSAAFLCGALGVTARALLQRTLDFRRLFVVDLASYAVGYAGVATGMALLGYGVWSLAWGALVQSLAGSLLALWMARHPLRPRLAWAELRELFSFGAGVSLNNVINYVARNGDNLIVGRWLGATALGLYGRAYNLMTLPLTYLSAVGYSVMFPRHGRHAGRPGTAGARVPHERAGHRLSGGAHHDGDDRGRPAHGARAVRRPLGGHGTAAAGAVRRRLLPRRVPPGRRPDPRVGQGVQGDGAAGGVRDLRGGPGAPSAPAGGYWESPWG
jgi:lipopolysaccharide/colanic/teichoic acid biosynthesis glycosyltransferase